MGDSGIVRPRADWVGVLDAAYTPGGDDHTWAQGVLEALQPLFSSNEGVAMHAVVHDAECASGKTLVHLGTGAAGELVALAHREDLSALGPNGFRAYFYPPSMVTTQSELDPLLTPLERERMIDARRKTGFVDGIGILVHPEPGVAMAVFAALPRVRSPNAHERRLLSQIGLHLEAAFRLRMRPEVVKAVIALDDGRRSVDAHGGRAASGSLATRARRVEASRASLRVGTHEAALDLWTALVSGRYSLVPRVENGKRHYLVLENSATTQDIRALSRRELDVLSMAARGVSTKLVAYGLGLSPATVSSTLMRAASKLGLANRLELLRLAATLTGDPRTHALPETLTSAESAILDLLRQGMSNREIARLRARSVRTIANQVASLLRKTESASRRELVARLPPDSSVTTR